MNPTVSTYFLHCPLGQWSANPVLIFVLNSLRDAEIFMEFGRKSHNLREGNRNSLSRDKQNKRFLSNVYNSFLNYKIFPENGRYHLSVQATLPF